MQVVSSQAATSIEEGMDVLTLNIKQQVIVAIYMEYQKAFPNMKNINDMVLQISREKFNEAIDKLTNEGLIKGAKIIDEDSGMPLFVTISDVNMTPQGVDYVENKLEIIDYWEPEKKVEKAVRKVTGFGLAALAAFGQKVLDEVINGQN